MISSAHFRPQVVIRTVGSGNVVLVGIISGLVVLIGVILTEYLIRRRSMLNSMRNAALSVSIELGYLLWIFENKVFDTSIFDVGSEDWNILLRVIRNLNEITLRTRRRGIGFKKIREVAEEIVARLDAANARWRRGIALTARERESMMKLGLANEVFGAKPSIKRRAMTYDKEGLPQN